MLFAVLGVGTLSAQTDVTSTYLTNADLSSLDGWIRSDYTDWKTDGDANVIEFYHTWSANAGAAIGSTKDFHFKQTVTLPAGEYRLSVNAFYREGNGNGTNTKAYIHAGEQQQYVAAFSPGDLDSYTGSNDLYKAANAFSKGAFANAFDFTVENETTMEIGFKGYIDTYCSWCILGPVKLYQYSMDDFNNELLAARTKLQGLTGLNTVMQARLDAVLSETANVTQTKAAILEATAKVNALYDELVECPELLASINNLITICDNYSKETYSVAKDASTRTTFTGAISSANTNKDNATTVEELTTVYNTLETARQSYVVAAYPTEGNSFDMTFKIKNAEVASKDGWTTNADLASNVEYDGAPDVFALDKWHWGATAVYANQTISNLPSGMYTLTAMARTSGTNMCYVYATSNDVESKEVVIGGGDTGNPWGLVSVPSFFVNNGASMTLGLKGDINNTWFSVDNFKLSRTYDVTSIQRVITALLEEANALTVKPMNATIKQALDAVIAATDVTATNPIELDDMIAALNKAIADAEASVAEYEKVASYIAKANAIDESIASAYDYQDKYDNRTINGDVEVETIRQTLNVATANYVAANFKNEIILDEWGAESNAMWSDSTEHWDGTTGDGCTTYYDANGTNTTHTLSKTVKLGAGTYVFRGAGRSNANTKLTLSINLEGFAPVTFNAKGNTGFGIDTEGNATFSETATYAKRGDQNAGQGWEWEFIKFTLTEATEVTLTATCKTSGWGWASFANNSLWMDDATFEANVVILGEYVDAAQALVDEDKPMNAYKKTALEDAIADAKSKLNKANGEKITPTELNNANNQLDAAIAAVKASIAQYELINTYIAKAKLFDEDDADVLALETQYNEGSFTDAEPVRQALNVWTANYVATNFKNEIALTGWGSEGNAMWLGSGEHWDGTTGTYYDANGTNTTHSLSKTIELSAGTYVFRGAGRSSASAKLTLSVNLEGVAPVVFNAKDNTGRGIDTGGNAIFADKDANDVDVTYANENKGRGWEWDFVKFTLTETTEVTLTATSKTSGWGWASLSNIGLWMDNNTLISVAKILAEKPMDTEKKGELKELITLVEGATSDVLEDYIDALCGAIIVAEASAAEYKEIASYIAKADAIDESIAADYQTKYDEGAIEEDVVTVFQNLEVATYEYVTGNFTFAVPLEADGWISEGPVGGMTSQHYDGTSTSSYLEQSTAAWSSSAWEISYKYEKTLPAGKYVFKVAGRRAAGAGTTMSLVVTDMNDAENPIEIGSVNDFPEGDTGLGVNKEGVASFDANDKAGFANDNNGRGWQWRYVMFELDGETTVQVAVNAAATTNHQWMSFCDATVQMDEALYFVANQEGLAEITAEADSLVAETIMGDAERKALTDALNIAEPTTGGELYSKITALENAVADANAWVKAYNDAKKPLVDALERFESDYNDGENGALNHMANSRWETVLEKVQEAVTAKDVTNSYAGFADAAKNLTEALNAADVSIKEYAALDRAIKKANANWGRMPFQKPTEAKTEAIETLVADAQGVYDAAEADGEGVTSVTAELTAAIKSITLNAPAEGYAFYVTVATAGHPYEGYPIVATKVVVENNNPTGYGLTSVAPSADAPKLFTFTQVEGNKYNISFEMNGMTVYLTYGSLNGSAAGWKNMQIQATTDATKKGEFEIEPSATTMGGIQICNTVTGTYLDCQGGGSIYTDDDIICDEFALIREDTEIAAMIKISSANKISTCVLKFDAELPEGLKAYVCGALVDGKLMLEEVEGTLPAYTPCLLYAENGFTGLLSGIIVMDGYAAKVTNDDILFGAIREQKVTEGYVLQNKSEGPKFYIVTEEKAATIPAGKCWLEANESTRGFDIVFPDGTTAIDKVRVELTADGPIYTIDGKQVEEMKSGQIYIVGGKKVLKR